MENIWIGSKPNGDFETWAFKKDAPKGTELRRITFRFARVYMRFYGNRIVPKTGVKDSIVVHTCYTKDGKCLIGVRDLTAADGTKYADAWRESIHSEIKIEMNALL
jgi:hypothetical protein